MVITARLRRVTLWPRWLMMTSHDVKRDPRPGLNPPMTRLMCHRPTGRKLFCNPRRNIICDTVIHDSYVRYIMDQVGFWLYRLIVHSIVTSCVGEILDKDDDPPCWTGRSCSWWSLSAGGSWGHLWPFSPPHPPFLWTMTSLSENKNIWNRLCRFLGILGGVEYFDVIGFANCLQPIHQFP